MSLRTSVILSSSMLLGVALAASPLHLNEAKNHALGRHFEYFRDTSGNLDIAAISQAPFVRNDTGKDSVNFGYTSDAIWVRLTLNNQTAEPVWYLRLGTLVDRVELYQKGHTGWRMSALGRFAPFAQRSVRHRDLVFPLPLPPNKPETVYLKFLSAGNMTVQLDASDLRSFAAADHDAQFAFGLYFGLMFIMVAYNAFLFFATRDQTYLWYVLYVFSFSLMHLNINGFVSEYLWPDTLQMPGYFTPLFISIAGVFSVLFTRSMLGLRQLRGHMDWISRGMLVLFAIAVALAPFAPYTLAMAAATYSTLIAILSLTYCGVRRWLQGHRSARFFLLGWMALYAGIAAMLLRNLGILPHNFFTAYAMQIFSAAEVTLFSLALGDRVNQLREDSQKLQEVRRELEIARKMQLALVPPVNLEVPRVDIAHRYIPMLDVGGDFMDIRVSEDGVSIFVGDVSGHGISAAMIATTMKLSLATEGDRHRTPDARLRRLRASISELPDSAFVTACCAYFSTARGELTLASAGHQPVVVYHANQKKCFLYKPRGMPLGVKDASAEYTTEFVQVHPGDIAIFYTDGLVEQGIIAGAEFGLNRVQRILEANAQGTAHEIAEKMLHELELFSRRTRSTGFDDDIAFVIMKVSPA